MLSFFMFIIGTVLGSFSNVCIHSLPRGESIIHPTSHCPHCKTPIKPRHNIPIISFIFLKGRCAYCGSPISPRYPLVELVSGIMYLLLFRHFGFNLSFVIYALFSSALLIVFFIDLEHQVIPDSITIPGMAVGIVTSFFLPAASPLNCLLGLIGGGGLFFLIASVRKGGMGGGDIKFAALIGSFIGWKMTLLTAFIAFLAGALVGITLIILKKKKRKDPIPFGSFLSAGALVSLLWGAELIRWYLTFFE